LPPSETPRAIQPLLVLVTGLPGSGKSTVADDAADLLDAAVLAHDWAMSGLRPYPSLQEAMNAMDPPGHRAVGWSILGALARAELRRNRSVVLDGVARATELERCSQVSREERAELVVILVQCPDLDVHRSRIEHRDRAIPGWYEVAWDDVQRSRSRWSPPDQVQLSLDSTHSRAANRELLADLLSGRNGAIRAMPE
jgi:predicted kinase